MNNEVFEPLQVPEGVKHLIRVAPIFLIEKVQFGGAPVKHRIIADLKANGANHRPVKRPAYFPTKEFVMEKILLQDRPLFESDVMDCFHLLPVDEAWRWLV